MSAASAGRASAVATLPQGSSSATVVEMSTDVKTTIEKLQELDAIVKCRSVESHQEVEEDIEEVIQSLRKLDQQRIAAHEMLEAETITTSVLRHKVSTFDQNLKAEVARAVASARGSNSAQLKELQDKLTDMDKESDQLGKRHEVLELHNEVLQPELKKLHADHEKLVESLNAEVSRRASLKIVLNETEQELRDTNTQTESFESNIARLEDDLRQHKEQFTKDKKESMDKLEYTRGKLDDQTLENTKLSSDIEKTETGIVQSSLALKDKERAVRYVEASIERLQAREADVKERLVNAERTIALLHQTESRTKELSRKEEERYSLKRKEVEEKSEQIKKEIEVAGKETARLNEIRKKLKREMKQAKDARDLQATSLADIRESVDLAKRKMLFESGEGARLLAENRELEFRLTQLRDTHKANVQLYKDEITNLRDQVARERKTRQTMEDSYQGLQDQIQAQLADHTRTMRTITGKMEDSENADQELTKKTATLSEEIKALEADQVVLQQELQSVKLRLQQTRRALEQNIAALEDSIADLTEELSDLVEVLKENEPKLQSLEEDYITKQEEYEAKKRDMITLKNKRAGLEDTCKRLQRDLNKMHIPQDKLRRETLRCRAYTRKWLHQQDAEVKEMEEKVAERQQQLSAVLNENKRFKEACVMLEAECGRLKALYESSAEVEKTMEVQLRQCRDSLVEQWRVTKKMEENYCERDRVILKDISAMREHSDGRLHTLTELYKQFDQEIMKFTNFLYAIASQRRTPPSSSNEVKQ